jgi:cell division protein FtsB
MVAGFKKIKKGNDRKSIFFPILFSLIFLAVIGFLVITNWKINQKRAELQTKIENLKKEIQILEEKKAKLKAGILETEEESYWEEMAREQGYKRPGEEQVVVLPPKKNEKKETEKLKNLWEKFLEKIGF